MGQAPGGGHWDAGAPALPTMAAPALPTVAGAPFPPLGSSISMCFCGYGFSFFCVLSPAYRGPDLETRLSSEGEQCGSSPHSRKIVSEFHDVSLTVMLFGKSHPLGVDAHF